MSVRNTHTPPPPRQAETRLTALDIRPSLLTSALGYAARGMYVHPLMVGGKEPRWSDWEARATVDPDVIRRTWARAPFNVGVACGPSGLVAVDLDVPHDGQELPEDVHALGVVDGETMLAHLAAQAGVKLEPTMTVRTGRGGLHRVHRAPIGAEVRNSAGTVAPCVDVRAAGGYVVGIGSVVDGGTYRLESAAPPAALPDWLLGLIRSAAESRARQAGDGRRVVERLRSASRDGSREQRWARGVLASECADLAAMAPQSGRNQRLNLAAYRAGQLVGAGLLDLGEAEEALLSTARACGVGSSSARPYAREVDKTVASGLRAGVARPRFMDAGTRSRMGGAA